MEILIDNQNLENNQRYNEDNAQSNKILNQGLTVIENQFDSNNNKTSRQNKVSAKTKATENIILHAQWIETNFQGQTVLAVGHGIINKAIQAVYYDKMTREIPKMKNGEYRKLCIL